VRKVLGARVLQLWALLSGDFVKLVILSMLIAMPLAYWAMRQWLQNYAIHTRLSWWIFAASGLGILAITLMTVSFQSIKAAMMNPVRSLRSE
jgi:putative ABC transport system permease protein